MANNRPINRNPFRRRPWRGRRTNRTGRWVDCNSTALVPGEDCRVESTNFVCAVQDPNAMVGGTKVLLTGDFDMEWADRGEVRVDRVVGDIQVSSRSVASQNEWYLPMLRIGLLLVEEVQDIAAWVPPNLFLQEDLEEFEWMWLWQPDLEVQPPLLNPQGASGQESPQFSGFRNWDSTHLDLRVKRKLGKKDHLVMLCHAASLGPIINFSASAQHTLRAMLVG